MQLEIDQQKLEDRIVAEAEMSNREFLKERS